MSLCQIPYREHPPVGVKDWRSQSGLSYTWFSLFSLGSISSISAWGAVGDRDATGHHWTGLLGILTGFCFWAGCCHHTQKEDRKWQKQEHGPYLRVEKVKENNSISFGLLPSLMCWTLCSGQLTQRGMSQLLALSYSQATRKTITSTGKMY